MSTFAFLLLCVQACLIQTVFGCCCGYASSPIRAPAALGCGAAGFGYGVYSLGGFGLGGAWLGAYGLGGAGHGAYEGYGGAGSGDVAVAGELGVTGTTLAAGQIPVLGAVSFGVRVPAAGAVTISGSCGYPCGCYIMY